MRIGGVARHRQRITHFLLEALAEHLAQSLSLHRVIELRIQRIDVRRQPALAPQVVIDVFETGEDVRGGQAQALRHAAQQARGIGGRDAVVHALFGIQRLIAPDGLAILTPVAVQRPARQLLARVPLALAKVREPLRGVFVLELAVQLGRACALGRPQRGGVPFLAIGVIDRDEGRLAAHRQTNIAGRELCVHLAADCQDLLPLRLGVRLGDARGFPDAGDLHLVRELDLGLVHAAADGRCSRRLGRAGQRNMPLARQQAGGGVQADPATTGQVDLAPGVQVREVLFGPRRAIQGLHIRLELDEVAGHEPRGHPQVAEQRHQQLGRIAAGTGAQGQRGLGGLDARLHADEVTDVRRHPLVQPDDEIDRAHRAAVDAGQVFGQQGRRGRLDQEGRQLPALDRAVAERKSLGMRGQEKVKGVEHRHFDDQVDRDPELARLLREDQAGHVVALRVLLPVQEVVGRIDIQRVRQDAGPAMRRGPQPNELGTERNGPVVLVVGDVTKRDVDRHD